MSEENVISPVFFEKILIKFLFSDKKVRERVVPYLTPKIFDDKNNIDIVQRILDFESEYNRFPSFPELKMYLKTVETFNRLKEIIKIDLTDYTDDFIIDRIETWFRNKMIWNVNADIVEHLSDDDLSQIQNSVDNLREACAFSFNTKVGIDVFESEDEIFEFLHNKDKIISSGLRPFDNCVDGGFHEKTLTLFMAETNLGKSLIMSSLAVNNVIDNKNVLYVTCEMSKHKISERVLANTFDVEIGDLKKLPRGKFKEYFKQIKKTLKTKLFVEEYPPNSINANHIRNLLKELKVKKKFIPDVIYVDYLEIMAPIRRQKGDNSYSEIKRISEELRGVAVETGIPIVSAVQTNRSGFGSNELDLTDISQSIGTAATADIIIGVTQTDDMRKSGVFAWQLLKNRYGINKKAFIVAVDYYHMRIFEHNANPQKDNVNPKSQLEKTAEQQSNVDNAINDISGLDNGGLSDLE